MENVTYKTIGIQKSFREKCDLIERNPVWYSVTLMYIRMGILTQYYERRNILISKQFVGRANKASVPTWKGSEFGYSGFLVLFEFVSF